MEKRRQTSMIRLGIGYGSVFWITNFIVLVWAEGAARVMETLEQGEDISGVLNMLLLLAVVFVALYYLLAAWTGRLTALCEKSLIGMQQEYIQKDLMESGVSRKYSELELINRVTDDLRKILEWTVKGKIELLLSVILYVVAFVYLCRDSFLLTAILYMIMALNLMIPLVYNKYMVADYSKVMQANDNWAKRLQEGIQNYSCIKSVGAQETYGCIYEKDVHQFIHTVKCANRTVYMETGIKSGMNQFSNYMGYAVVGFFVLTGSINLAMAARTVFVIPLVQNILDLMVQKNNERRNIIVSTQRMNELKKKEKTGSQSPQKHDINICHVSFEYDGQQIFDDLGYQIGDGETVLVKGANGTGKSTLLKLLTGLYALKEGKICFGGILSGDVQNGWLRENIFYLPQGNLCIPGTVEDNLKIRNICPEEGEIPGDLLQNVQNLSEGQKKKIALMELYRTDKCILLLDEPENHLDSETLGKLVDFLKKGGRTVILVIHVSAFDGIADKIWELKREAER